CRARSSRRWLGRWGAADRALDPLADATEIALPLRTRDLAIADIAAHLATLCGALLGRHRLGRARWRSGRGLARRRWRTGTAGGGKRDRDQKLRHGRQSTG